MKHAQKRLFALISALLIFIALALPASADAIVPTDPIEEITQSSSAPYLAAALIVIVIAVTAILILRLFRKK